jgi:hypothetical protein
MGAMRTKTMNSTLTGELMHYAAHIFLAFSIGLAAIPDQPIPKTDPDIELPIGPAIDPIPPVPPAGVYTLNAGEMFVIGAKAKCRVKAYPESLVTVCLKTGPRDITGKFSGGKGDEDRTFSKPFLYVVKATGGKGSVTIEITPYGFADDKQIVTTTIDVNGGQEIPTPIPDVKPKPSPTPVALGKLSIVAILDRKVANPAQAQALASDALRTFISQGGHELDLVDLGTTTGQAQAKPFEPFATTAGVAAPYLVVMDLGSTPPGKVLTVKALPSKDVDILSVLKPLTGK